MIRPLTKDERRAWQLGTEDIATNARGFVSAEVLAMNRQRYEATLRAKDAQIVALVKACRKFSKAHSYISNGLEPPDNASVDPQDWAEFDHAVEEATG